MSDTKIEWATKVLNPVRGCTKVSEGCRNCYAIKFSHRFHGEGMPFEGLTEKTAAGLNWTGKLILVPIARSRKEIKKWKEPQRVFVNSMSDLFHDDVPNWFLDDLFGLLIDYPQHTFMILTKRPQRMMEYMQSCQRGADIVGGKFPWSNVWLGVSVENQKAADERIPLLLKTPAAIRFLSCEPLLGPLNITPYLWDIGTWEGYEHEDHIVDEVYSTSMEDGIKLVIVGGESGHGARPMHPEWARSLRDQCQVAGTSFFFKQWGEWAPFNSLNPQPDHKLTAIKVDNETLWRVGKGNAGRLLDDREWNEIPNQIQEAT